jgi:hypothetical protein
MSHEHSHDQHGHHNHQTHPKQNRPIHHKWWFWVGLILMLVGMGIYVTSDNEALQPGGQDGPQIPAAAE